MILLDPSQPGGLLGQVLSVLVILIVVVPTSLIVCIGVYNLFFHPLSGYPGPFLARASRIWYLTRLMNGDLAFDIAKAHDQYGETVRIAPNELSFTAASAWKDIFASRPGKPEMTKDPVFYAGTVSVNSLLDANKERHTAMRRLLSYGFSASALREQYPVVEDYVALLIDTLADAGENGKIPVDIVRFWNVRALPVQYNRQVHLTCHSS